MKQAGATRARARWRCRRGLLELDLVLERFARRHLDGLSGNELAAFAELLELPDLELWGLIAGNGEGRGRVLELLRKC